MNAPNIEASELCHALSTTWITGIISITSSQNQQSYIMLRDSILMDSKREESRHCLTVSTSTGGMTIIIYFTNHQASVDHNYEVDSMTVDLLTVDLMQSCSDKNYLMHKS